MKFAVEKRARDKAKWQPKVVGAVIDLGLCLDLTTETGVAAVTAAYQAFSAIQSASGDPMPSNSGGADLMLRKLDCAVIRTLHDIRAGAGERAIDAVVGVFLEGEPIYEGSGFRNKTHTQLCVRTPRSIRAVFNVHGIG